MPQLDPSTFISQLFWLILCLGMVVLCFARIFIPRFNAMLEKRFSKINYDLDQAQLFESQSKALAQKYELELLSAKKNAEEQIKNTMSELLEKKRQQLIHIDEELSNNLKAMEKSFERQQKLMLSTLAPIADECAQQILQHVLGQKNHQTSVPLDDKLAQEKKHSPSQKKKTKSNARN